MELMSLCRICLSNATHKDVSDLRANDDSPDVIHFCLNIKVEEESKISSKLCLKCFNKIMSFYKFKLLAIKNDAYLKRAEAQILVKNEVFLRDDIKEENVLSYNSDVDDVILNMKLEPYPVEEDPDSQSDNEILSVIKKIKYEFVPEDPIAETKENATVKTKRGKRGRPPKLMGLKNKTVTTAQVCEECGKTVKNLKDHMLQHLPIESRKRYPCALCEKTFMSPRTVMKHTKFKHLGQKKACPICNKLIINLRAHMLLVHKNSELRHACASCGRRFISQSALDAHTSVHTKDRPHECDKCDKRFRSKIVMMQHRRQVHDQEKSHMCQFCSKSFFKKYHLQVHLRSHTKEKPYQCPDCDKSFSSSTILKNHRTVHSDLKKYECTLCSMSFARLGYLRVHTLSHTKEKKHPCKYCGIKFGRSDHRKRHEYTAHERHLVSNLTSKTDLPVPNI